jgi:zinc/manganese transport system permease protein
LLALLEAWLGIGLAYLTDWPVSFWISALSVAVYLAACSVQRVALQTVTRHPIGG